MQSLSPLLSLAQSPLGISANDASSLLQAAQKFTPSEFAAIPTVVKALSGLSTSITNLPASVASIASVVSSAAQTSSPIDASPLAAAVSDLWTLINGLTTVTPTCCTGTAAVVSSYLDSISLSVNATLVEASAAVKLLDSAPAAQGALAQLSALFYAIPSSLDAATIQVHQLVVDITSLPIVRMLLGESAAARAPDDIAALRSAVASARTVTDHLAQRRM